MALKYLLMLAVALLFGVVGYWTTRYPSRTSGLTQAPEQSLAVGPQPGGVLFRIAQIDDAAAGTTWLATYDAGGQVAQFRIRLQIAEPAPGSPFAFSAGALYRQPGSDPSVFLRDLALALEASSHDLPPVQKADDLPVQVAILGTGLSRDGSEDGSPAAYLEQPEGDWIATKLFLAEGQAEVYLNLNPAAGWGEFAIKDPESGDAVLAELAKVL